MQVYLKTYYFLLNPLNNLINLTTGFNTTNIISAAIAKMTKNGIAITISIDKVPITATFRK